MGPFRCRSARSHGIGRHPSFGHSKYDIQEGPCLVASTCAVMVQAHVNDERQGDRSYCSVLVNKVLLCLTLNISTETSSKSFLKGFPPLQE